MEADPGEDGKQFGTYLRTDEDCARQPQKALDRFWVGSPTVRHRCCHLSLYSVDLANGLPDLPPAKMPLESARNGYEHYKHQAYDQSLAWGIRQPDVPHPRTCLWVMRHWDTVYQRRTLRYDSLPDESQPGTWLV